jgi:RecA-family ATPase
MKKVIKLSVLVKNAKDSVEMLINNFLPKVGLAGLIGESDIGKSTLLLVLALFVSRKMAEFLGMQMNVEHGRVLYVSTEDDESNFGPRVKKLCKKYEISEEELENIEFFFTDDYESVEKNLDSFLSSSKFDLVVIDAFSDILNEDGNNATAVRKVLRSLSAITAKHKCLILILHHTRKSARNEPGKHDVLGSSAFEAKMRTLIGLYSGSEPNEVKMKILKGNYLSPEDKQAVRYLSFVDQHFTLKNVSIEVKSEIPRESKAEKAKKIISELLELHGDTKSNSELFKEAETLGYPFGKSKFYSDIKEARSTTLSYGF